MTMMTTTVPRPIYTSFSFPQGAAPIGAAKNRVPPSKPFSPLQLFCCPAVTCTHNYCPPLKFSVARFSAASSKFDIVRPAYGYAAKKVGPSSPLRPLDDRDDECAEIAIRVLAQALPNEYTKQRCPRRLPPRLDVRQTPTRSPSNSPARQALRTSRAARHRTAIVGKAIPLGVTGGRPLPCRSRCELHVERGDHAGLGTSGVVEHLVTRRDGALRYQGFAHRQERRSALTRPGRHRTAHASNGRGRLSSVRDRTARREPPGR